MNSYEKIALLVVDMQNTFYNMPSLKQSIDSALNLINPTIELFRSTSNPIFYVQHADNSILKQGSHGFELIDSVDFKDGEHKIIKHHYNSFYQTSLAEELKKNHVDMVVLCGLAASRCIRSTVQGALENNFKAAVLQHGVADAKESLTLVPYETCPLVSIEALQYFLSK